MKAFVVPSIFTAVDKFTRPVQVMARQAETSMARMERRFRKVGNVAGQIGRTSGVIGLGLTVPLVYAAKAAVDFEDKMADVAKVANVTIGSAGFEAISAQALNLSKTLAITGEEAAGLMAGLAQGGVAITDLERVSLLAGKMGVAFGITGDEAGQAFIKTKNALGGTIESTAALMDSINMLGNTTAAASDEIVNFMATGGSAAARAANATGESVAAMGAQLISMGISAEESATVIRRFTQKALSIKPLRKVFDDAGGGAAGMMAIIEKGSKMSGKAQDKYFSQFGEYGIKIQLMSKEFGSMKEKIDNATNAQLVAGSVQDEFANRAQTAAFKFGQLKAKLMESVIVMGNALIPVLTSAVNAITPIIEKTAAWMSQNKETVKSIGKTVVIIAGLALGISALSFAVSIGTKAFDLYKNSIDAYGWVSKKITPIISAFNAAMLANPVGMFIAVTAALAAATYVLSDSFKSVTREQRLSEQVRQRALDNTIDQRVEASLLFGALRKAAVGSDEFNTTLQKLELMQPGIIKNYDLMKGKLDDINRAEQDLAKNIMARAMIEARADMIKEKTKELFQSKESGVSMMDYFNSLINGKGLNAEWQKMANEAALQKDIEFLANNQEEDVRALEPSISKNMVTIDFKNMPEWVQTMVTGQGKQNLSLMGAPRTTTTN